MGEPLWLEPYPDVMLEDIGDRAAGPDARYETKEAVALAFVTGLQHPASRQRALLVLRDVLGFGASEVADMLEVSQASVKSARQRARGTLESRTSLGAGARERAPLPSAAVERELLAQFAQAFEVGDADRIVALLTDEALLTMPEGCQYSCRALHARVGRIGDNGLLVSLPRVQGPAGSARSDSSPSSRRTTTPPPRPRSPRRDSP
jgi:Sigma-70, region 4